MIVPYPYAVKAAELLRTLVPRFSACTILNRFPGDGSLFAAFSRAELSRTVFIAKTREQQRALAKKYGCTVLLMDPLARGFMFASERPVVVAEMPFERPQRWKSSHLAHKIAGERTFASLAFRSAFSLASHVLSLIPPAVWKSTGSWQTLGGCLFNGKHFMPAFPKNVLCGLWAAREGISPEMWASAWDMEEGKVFYCGGVEVKRVSVPVSAFRETREPALPVFASRSGFVEGGVPEKDFMGYLVLSDDPFLLFGALRQRHGFYLWKDTFLEKLPLFSAARYAALCKDWWDTAGLSGDGLGAYIHDVKSGALKSFLLKNLLFCCLDNHNRIRSQRSCVRIDSPRSGVRTDSQQNGAGGNEEYLYVNEIALDRKDQKPTVALALLSSMVLNHFEQDMVRLWRDILKEARKSDRYKPEYTYTPYQVSLEIAPWVDGMQKKLKKLQKMLERYYMDEIVEIIFKYKILK